MSAPEQPAPLRFDNIAVSPRGISEVHGRQVMVFVPAAEVERITLRFGRTAHRPLLTLTMSLLLIGVGVFGIVKFKVNPKFFRFELAMLALGMLGAILIFDTLKRRYFLAVHQRNRDSHLILSKKARKEEIQTFCDQVSEVYRYEITDAT